MAEALGVASAVVSLLTLAAQVTKLSYLYVSDYRNASQSQKSYLLELSALSNILLQVESIMQNEDQTFTTTFGAQLTALINDCRPTLEQLRGELESRAVKNGQVRQFLSDVVWPFKEKEVKQHIEVIHRFRSMISNVVSLHTHSISIGTQEKMGVLKMEHEKRQIGEWLALPDARVSTTLEEDPCPGTMEWFFQTPEYLAWKVSPKSMLWCHGKPGVGKSMLSAAVLQQIAPKSTALYHFCNFLERTQQSTVILLKLLIQQVLSTATESQVSVLLKHREKSTASPKAGAFLSALLEACPARETFLVIDALDEFEDRRALLPILGQLVQAGWRVMATSRQLPDIEGALHSYPQVEVAAAKEDVEVYVTHRLEESDFDSISNKPSIVNSIVEKAGGIFLLARLIMDRLLELTTVKEMRLFLANMPSTVHDGYTSSLDRILALPPSRSAVALRTIGWIVRAERRLRISEVLHAFAYEANTNDIDDDNILSPKLVIQSCVGLVYLDKENSTLGLIHETAYQFLRGIPQLQNVETDIATTSIGYLSLQCLSSPCADLSTLLQRQASKPFLSYAAQFWGIHSRRVEGQILPQILSFLGNSHRIASSFQVLQSGEWKGPELAVAIFQSLPSGQEPLHIAAFWGLDATISSLLSAGADPDVQDHNGWAPLHWAASNGHSTSVDILLNTSVDVNAADLRGWTPLFWAAFRGHQHIAATLLKKGANHRLRDNNGWACLHWAISTRQVEIVKMLLDHHRDFTTGLSQPQIPVETLNDARVGGTNLKLRADLADTTIDDGYIAPLELAAETGDVSIFELLLKGLGPFPGAGSRDLDELNEETLNEWPWQPDFKFDLPLENIWMALIKFRHARERPEENWMTSMLLKAIRGNKLHVAEMLLELGADPSLVAVYSPGLTALHVATFRQDTRFVDLILKFDPKTISLRDVGGRTALMQAVINGSPSIAKILLDHGSEVNIQDQAGNTPLICAARVKSPLNSLELVRELLRRGAEISVQNSRRETVLHHAVPEVIETLLAAGADPKVIDKGGKTVLDTFIEHRFFSIAEEKPEHNRVLLTLLELCETSPKHQNAALERGNWTAFRLLLAHGVEPTRDFVWRNQTLAKAVIRAGQLDILRYLLEKGAVLTSYLAYPSIVHKLFKPQHYQAQIMEVEKMEAAFEVLQTFYPEVLSREMMTSVLHYAIIMTESEGHIRLLLKYGASIFDVDDLTPSIKEDGYERTRVDAFVHSVLHGRWEALSFFITLLGTVPAPPCHWISQLNVNGTISSDDHIRQLLDEIHRAGKFNCLGEGEWTRNAPPKLSTPVQLATRRGDLRGLKFLFEATGCADVEAVDKWGWTLLHWAIYLGHHDIFNFLLECGADVSARTASWASTSAPADNLDIKLGAIWRGQPIHLARMQSQSEMAEALVLRGADSNSLV